VTQLLPANTLAKVRLGVSASPSPDLGRVGLLEEHFRLALGELARTVLVLGGHLQYCGHLDPNGYTPFLIGELKRYGQQDDPLSIVLAWSVHRRLPLKEILRAKADLGLFGIIRTLDVSGTPMSYDEDRGEDPPGLPSDQVGPSLTAMRRTAIRQTQGRLFIGGKRSGYQGVMPGVLEEALLVLDARQPIFLAGGFGGVTHDIIARIDASSAAWLPVNQTSVADEGWQHGMKSLSELNAGRGWAILANGLDPVENARLAATYRSSEIAALVSLGLGRLAQSGAFSPGIEPLP
jgi:SLOG cluster2